MKRPAFESVDDYFAAQPESARAVLERVRATIRRALPRATERIAKLRAAEAAEHRAAKAAEKSRVGR